VEVAVLERLLLVNSLYCCVVNIISVGGHCIVSDM